jgi:hypothetical protein
MISTGCDAEPPLQLRSHAPAPVSRVRMCGRPSAAPQQGRRPCAWLTWASAPHSRPCPRTLAATMKSFSVRPPLSWLHSTTVMLFQPWGFVGRRGQGGEGSASGGGADRGKLGALLARRTCSLAAPATRKIRPVECSQPRSQPIRDGARAHKRHPPPGEGLGGAPPPRQQRPRAAETPGPGAARGEARARGARRRVGARRQLARRGAPAGPLPRPWPFADGR